MSVSSRTSVAAVVALTAALGAGLAPVAFADAGSGKGAGHGHTGTQPADTRGHSGKEKCVDPNQGKAADSTSPNPGSPAEHLDCKNGKDKGDKPAEPKPTTPAPQPTTPQPTTPAPTTPAPTVTTPASPATPIDQPKDDTTRPGSTVEQPKDDTTRPGSTVEQPRDETTRPGSTVVTRPAPRMVTRTFQVDRYMPRTAAQARVVARLDDDGRLRYREDRPLWGASRWQFVSVRVPVNASKAQVVKAVNAKTSARVGDVRTASRLSSMRAGRSVTVAWELGKGATTSHAWGARNTVAQTFLARS